MCKVLRSVPGIAHCHQHHHHRPRNSDLVLHSLLLPFLFHLGVSSSSHLHSSQLVSCKGSAWNSVRLLSTCRAPSHAHIISPVHMPPLGAKAGSIPISQLRKQTCGGEVQQLTAVLGNQGGVWEESKGPRKGLVLTLHLLLVSLHGFIPPGSPPWLRAAVTNLPPLHPQDGQQGFCLWFQVHFLKGFSIGKSDTQRRKDLLLIHS